MFSLPPSEPLDSALPPWHSLKASQVRRWPLPELSSPSDRTLARLAGLFALWRVRLVEGWENILPDRDPFVLAANHSSRREALLLPAVLLLARGGKRVRFLADWNFALIPGIGPLYRRSGAITLTCKSARPRLLNRLKPRFQAQTPPFEEAKRHLAGGGSIGLFPEGTRNRDPCRLLRGRRGAARLSLETGAPIIPVGIRFDRVDEAGARIDSSSAISIHIGAPLFPLAERIHPISRDSVTAWHARLMREIGQLRTRRYITDSRHESTRQRRSHLIK